MLLPAELDSAKVLMAKKVNSMQARQIELEQALRSAGIDVTTLKPQTKPRPTLGEHSAFAVRLDEAKRQAKLHRQRLEARLKIMQEQSVGSTAKATAASEPAQTTEPRTESATTASIPSPSAAAAEDGDDVLQDGATCEQDFARVDDARAENPVHASPSAAAAEERDGVLLDSATSERDIAEVDAGAASAETPVHPEAFQIGGLHEAAAPIEQKDEPGALQSVSDSEDDDMFEPVTAEQIASPSALDLVEDILDGKDDDSEYSAY